jgi:hypothetical protein
MQHLHQEQAADHGNAVALLAVHSAISFSDAILAYYTGSRSKEADHRACLTRLRLVCGDHRIDDGGLRHLSWLLDRKTDFAYGDKPLKEPEESDNAFNKADKFAKWVSRSFPEIAPPG